MAEDRIFTLEADKVECALQWIATHPCSIREKEDTTVIGGKTSYHFVDTSIGQIKTVRCACGASECLSDDL